MDLVKRAIRVLGLENCRVLQSEIDADDSARRDELIRLPSGKTLLCANSGYVINFNGSTNPTPPRFIQLTRGLLYLAAVQATRTRQAGFSDLEQQPQREFVHYIEAVTDCDVLEASTPHLDDVVRLKDRYGREGTNAP